MQGGLRRLRGAALVAACFAVSAAGCHRGTPTAEVAGSPAGSAEQQPLRNVQQDPRIPPARRAALERAIAEQTAGAAAIGAQLRRAPTARK